MFLARAMLPAKSKFRLSLASFLCFVLTSPQCCGDKTLRTFSVRLILAGSKQLSWMIFPNDIMARLAAMFHAASCESKLLAHGGYRHLLNPLTHRDDCTHTFERTCVLGFKHLFLPFLCLHVFDFFFSLCN